MKKNTIQKNLKNVKQILAIVIIGIVSISCSSDDGFSNANGNVAKKYIEKIISRADNRSTVTTINYDSSDKVSSISDGNDSKYFSYGENGKLKKVSGGGESFLTSEIMGEIYDAYEIGNVIQFDTKGNPTVLEVYEYYHGEKIINTAHISYDDKPFMFYYTMEAAGIIDVLYDVRLKFIAPQQIITARQLLPVNNPVKAIIKNSSNLEIGYITVTYSYSQDKYPTSSSVIAIDEYDYVETYNVNYEYRQ